MAGGIQCSRCGRELTDGMQLCSYGGPCSADVSKGATAAESATGALAGWTVGKYKVKELIGTGGMGEVYAGEQLVIGKKVAIKVLKTSAKTESAAFARMLAEAQAVSAIRHRGIVDIFDFGTISDGRPYLVMEYLDGMRLDRAMRQVPGLSEKQILKLLAEICTPLAAAHKNGIVHRDLKPENVFVMTDTATGEQYVKLLDFGLAKNKLAPLGANPLTREGFVVGTPDYIAPEQARGTGTVPQSDLYSLGVMAFEMVARRLPFAASSPTEMMTRHVHAPVPNLRAWVPEVTPALDVLVGQLMAKRVEDRPASADLVRRTLLAIEPGPGSVDTTQVELPQIPRGNDTGSRPTLDAVDPVTDTSAQQDSSHTSLTFRKLPQQLWRFRRVVAVVALGAGLIGALIGHWATR